MSTNGWIKKMSVCVIIHPQKRMKSCSLQQHGCMIGPGGHYATCNSDKDNYYMISLVSGMLNQQKLSSWIEKIDWCLSRAGKAEGKLGTWDC